MPQTVGFSLAGKQSRGTLWDLELLGSAAGPRLLADGPGACPPLILWWLVLQGPSFPCLPWVLDSSRKAPAQPWDEASSRGHSWHCRTGATGATLSMAEVVVLGLLPFGYHVALGCDALLRDVPVQRLALGPQGLSQT